MSFLHASRSLFSLLLIAATPLAAQLSDIMDLDALGQTGTPGWEPFHGAQFRTAPEGTRHVIASIPSEGSGDRGAYLKGIQFSQGVIQVDLKGTSQPASSFLGIVFHGEDGEAYDAVYFRPFNFNQSDATRRSHAVQYMSHPDWKWQRLRNERPGQYESQAAPEPQGDQWFHARIEIAGRRVQVFIGDSSQPCLDITKVSATTTGKVGLWFNGNASFSNLQIKPKE